MKTPAIVLTVFAIISFSALAVMNNACKSSHHSWCSQRVHSKRYVQHKGGQQFRLIATASFALAVATCAEAMTAAPIHQPESMITKVAYGCGLGRHELLVSA